jgi:hypothetical protein
MKSLRRHYSSLFSRVPTYVKRIYEELNAHKALNYRMKQEMLRLQETMTTVLTDLDHLKFNQQDEEEHNFASPKSTESSIPMKRYLDLYSLRLGRLEKTLKHSEEERLFWVDSVKHLILKYGKEHKMNSLIDFHRREQLRYTDVNAKIAFIQGHVLELFHKIDEHFKRLVTLISDLTCKLEAENATSMTVIFKLKLDITNFSEILPVNTEEGAAPIMSKISTHDVQTLIRFLVSWTDQLQLVANIYNPENEDSNSRVWVNCKEHLDAIDSITRCVFSIFSGMPGVKEFQRIADYERTLLEQTTSWLEKMKIRIVGENGVIGNVLWLQNQMEDL